MFNIFLTSGVKLHINLWTLWTLAFRFIFPQFCKSDISRYGYLKVFKTFPWTSRWRESTACVWTFLEESKTFWQSCRSWNCIYSPLNMFNYVITAARAGLGGSVGCAVRLETRRSRVQPPPRSATFFRGDWSWNIFYGHSLPSADSRRAVVSFWRKNVHNTG